MENITPEFKACLLMQEADRTTRLAIAMLQERSKRHLHVDPSETYKKRSIV